MRFSQRGQFLARFVRPICLTGGDLLKGAIDFVIKSAPFFARPRSFGFQSFQSAANNVRLVGEAPVANCFCTRASTSGGTFNCKA
jgi:hypothetical protein